MTTSTECRACGSSPGRCPEHATSKRACDRCSTPYDDRRWFDELTGERLCWTCETARDFAARPDVARAEPRAIDVVLDDVSRARAVCASHGFTDRGACLDDAVSTTIAMVVEAERRKLDEVHEALLRAWPEESAADVGPLRELPTFEVARRVVAALTARVEADEAAHAEGFRVARDAAAAVIDAHVAEIRSRELAARQANNGALIGTLTAARERAENYAREIRAIEPPSEGSR